MQIGQFYLEKIIELLPANIFAQLKLIETFLNQNKISEALKGLNKISQIFPKLPENSIQMLENAVRYLNRKDLDQNLIIPGEIQTLVCSRAEKAILAGADGVIASPQELSIIRENPLCMQKIIVTPGIRPANSVVDDQKRVATPYDALNMGASHLVIGRPIYQAKDPVAAYEEIKIQILNN